MLTNANLLSCENCSHFNLSGSGADTCNTSCFLLRTCGSSAYQGHYVLAVGFDIPKRKIYYRNPTLRDRGRYFWQGIPTLQGRKWLPKTEGAFYFAKKWGGGRGIAPPLSLQPRQLRPCINLL